MTANMQALAKSIGPNIIFHPNEKFFPVTIEHYARKSIIDSGTMRLRNLNEQFVSRGNIASTTEIETIEAEFSSIDQRVYVCFLPHLGDGQPAKSLSSEKNFLICYNLIFPFRMYKAVDINMIYARSVNKNNAYNTLIQFQSAFTEGSVKQNFGQIVSIIYKFKDMNTLEEIMLYNENSPGGYTIIKNPSLSKHTFYCSLSTHNIYDNSGKKVLNEGLSLADYVSESGKFLDSGAISHFFDVTKDNITQDAFGSDFDWASGLNFYGNLENGIYVYDGKKQSDLTTTSESSKGPMYRINDNYFNYMLRTRSYFTKISTREIHYPINKVTII
jgi:hypothetical protein